MGGRVVRIAGLNLMANKATDIIFKLDRTHPIVFVISIK
jgi:hypothetical protein